MDAAPTPDLLDAIRQPVWTVRPDGTVAYANHYWREYTGLGPEQAIGCGWATAVHPDDIPAIERRWDAASQAGAPYEIEYRFRRADGTYRWHLARVAPVGGSASHAATWVGVGIDIDDRRRAETSLRDSEARYRAVVAHADDIVYTARLDGTIVDVNPAVERILGYRPDQLIGRSLETLLTPEQLEQSRAMLARKVAGAASTVYELDVLAAAGHRVPLEINTRLVADGDGLLIHGIARDISTRRCRMRQAELGAAVGGALTSPHGLGASSRRAPRRSSTTSARRWRACGWLSRRRPTCSSSRPVPGWTRASTAPAAASPSAS